MREERGETPLDQVQSLQSLYFRESLWVFLPLSFANLCVLSEKELKDWIFRLCSPLY